MNISYALSVLTRAKDSVAVSKEPVYKEIINTKIISVENALCIQESVSSIEEIIDLRKELSGELPSLVADLDVSI
ncbi:MAG: hypothetical protein WCL02_09440 [bacterium]